MQRRFNATGLTTLKVTSKSLELLSKTLAVLRSHFNGCVFSQSSVLVNQETGAYFCHLNLNNEDLAVKLQEITPYGVPAS